MEDLYRVLGVPRDADAATIRKTFKKLARELHPDRNRDPSAGERFKQVTAANEVLGDPQRRALYDEFGEASLRAGFDADAARAWKARGAMGGGPGGAGGFPGFEGGSSFGGGFGFEDILGNLFGGGRGGGGGRRPSAGEDVVARVTLTLPEVARGVQVPVRVPRVATCGKCQGAGGSGRRSCTSCGGSGKRAMRQFGMASSIRCDRCNGTGATVADTCPACGGHGSATQEATLQVRIPAGADGSRPLRLRGQGSVGSHGGAAGDVLVHVDVAPHPLLRRQDRDLEMDLPLSLTEAMEGAELDIPVVTGSGSIRLRVPPGAANGARLRVPGKGIQTDPPGNLYLVLRPQTPQVPAAQAEEAARLARELDLLGGARDLRANLQL